MSILGAILAGIAAHQLLFFAGLLALVVLIILVMAIILLRGRKAAEAAPPPAAAKEPPPAAALPPPEPAKTAPVPAEAPLSDVTLRDLRRLFRAGLAAYRETLSRNVYLVPWYLRMGVVPSDDGGLLSCADEARPPVAANDRVHGFRWRFYDRAVAIDIDDARVARRAVLDQLARRRAMLPADGLILTIPLSELEDPRRAAARGAELYGQLWEMQRTLGFALPVYVVVTGCERIAGFHDLVDALPESLRDGMLGWSSPYPLEAAFSADLVEEALHSISDGLLAVQLEIFGASGTDEGAGLVALGDRISGTETSLRALLGTAFKRTAYQESLFFRGLYFIGRLDAEAPAVFGRDLLNRKIFHEAGLPKPTHALAAVRTWRRYAWPGGTALAAVLGLALLWIGVDRANSLSDRLVPLLADIPSNLQQMADQRAAVAAGGTLPATFADPAARFVKGVATLPDGWPFSPLPASWIGGATDEATKALAVGYRRVVLGTVHDVVEQRLRRLSQGGEVGGGSELDKLRRFAADLGIAEGVVKAYNGVDQRDSTETLDDLLEVSLGGRVARGFSNRLRSWSIDLPPSGGAIPAPGPGAQRPIDITGYRADLTRRFRQLCDAYFRDLAMGGLAVARLSVAANELEQLAGGGRRGDDAVIAYNEVLAAFNAASQGLSLERGAWIGTDGPTLPPEFDALLTRVEKSDLLAPNLRAGVLELAQRRYDEAGAGSRSLDSVIGRLLVQTSSGVAKLSPAAENLRQTLASWMSRRFMRTADPQAAAPRPVAAWDQAALEAVPPLVEDYLLFDAKDVPQAPDVLRPSMRAAARRQLLRAVEPTINGVIAGDSGDWIDRSGGLPGLRDAARSLRLAFPVLAETMQSFRQIGLGASSDAIRDAVARRATAILVQADRLLQDAQLYRPDLHGLDGWVDGPLVPYQVFGQTSPAGLTIYLGNARQEIASLAHDVADPLIAILRQPSMGKAATSGLAAKWARILEELDKYSGEKPNSSLARLEKFITVDSAAIDAEGCKNLPLPDGNAVDYFQSRLNDLTQAIGARCGMAAESRYLRAYLEIAGLFNQTLAGRFPFAPTSEAEPADPAAIRAFYDSFDARRDDLAKFVNTARPGVAEVEARRFVERMAGARALLTAVAQPDRGGGVALDPTFRVNRPREIGGADIIEWRIDGPTTAISNLLPRKPMHWYPGDPLTVTLRWAKDGKIIPTGGFGPTPAKIDGPSLSFRFDGPWALFALLRQQSAPLRDRPARADVATLQFEATTKREVVVPPVAVPDRRTVESSPSAVVSGAPVPVTPGAIVGPYAVAPQEPARPLANTRVYMALSVTRTVTPEGKPAREEKVALPDLPVLAPLPGGGVAPAAGLRPGFGVYPGSGTALGSYSGASAVVAPIDRSLLGLGAPPPDQPFLRPSDQRLD